VAFVAEENAELVPGNLGTEWFSGEKDVEGFGSGAAGEGDVEDTVIGDRGFGGVDEEFGGAPGDGGGIRKNVDFAILICGHLRDAYLVHGG
jgi:hypothetical protein